MRALSAQSGSGKAPLKLPISRMLAMGGGSDRAGLRASSNAAVSSAGAVMRCESHPSDVSTNGKETAWHVAASLGHHWTSALLASHCRGIE